MKNGKPSDKVIYPIMLDRAEFERVKALAREEDLNGAQFIRRSIRKAIEQRQRRTQAVGER